MFHFDRISSRYDLFNHLTSFGIDYYWRHRTIRAMQPCHEVLDVAIGTADLSIAMLRAGKADCVEGIDLSAGMMACGKRKVEKKGLSSRVTFTQGSALEMPYADGRFDALTCAYGIRNFGDTPRGLSEFFRVLQPGGQLLILEFSHPQNKVFAALYDFYFRYIMTPIGTLLTHDRGAFEYFYQSVRRFIWGDEMKRCMEQAGFQDVTYTTMTFGISTLYLARKPHACS